jgi:hypothetical protein
MLCLNAALAPAKALASPILHEFDYRALAPLSAAITLVITVCTGLFSLTWLVFARFCSLATQSSRRRMKDSHRALCSFL